MRTRLLFIGSCLFTGVSFGAAESLLWKRSLSLIGLDAAVSTAGLLVIFCSLFALFLLSSLYLLPQVLYRPVHPFRCIWFGMISLVLGGSSFLLFRALIIPLSYDGWLWTVLISAGSSLPIALLIWLFTRGQPRHVLFSFKWALLVFVLLLVAAASFKADPSVEDAFGLGGFSVYRAILLRNSDSSHPLIAFSLLAGAAVGLLAGVFWSLFTKTRMLNSLAFGSFAGAVVSVSVCVSHLVQFAAVVGSGCSINTAIFASLLCNAALGLAFCLSLLLISCRSRVLAALPTILFVAAGIFYVHRAYSGSEVFKAAQATHSYRTFVYLHYTAGGGWRRTSDTRSDDLKILIYDRLIKHYPNNMHRPEAMFERAIAAYDAWRFGDAVKTLSDLHAEYPGSIGSTRVLFYLSLLANGQPAEAAHVAQSNDPLFQSWLSHEGSRLAAIPYAELGLRSRATGLYSRYLDYLLAEHDGKWVSPAAKSAEDTITELQQAINDDKPLSGRVTGTVVGPGPIKGVRIALVKPQLDASSLSDSRQFTGPRTLPLWQGRSATVSSNGAFVIDSVPYGSYDIVVGLDAAAIPERCVLEPLKSPVKVNSPMTKLLPVKFIRSVELLSPKDGYTVSCSPVLSWKPHPQARSYTVSVVSTSSPTAEGYNSSSAYTCWSKAGIKSTSVVVDAGGFNSSEPYSESTVRRLLPGRSYMWIVYACDAEGGIISSSEHYRLGHEPSFTTVPSGSFIFKPTQN